jgi:cytochrome c oxidase accessory protein FixG
MIVAYDYVRGEPRGNAKKVADPTSLGDCIDCHQCVKVCPTGIDIRDGVQLECVGCTACIDACDNIMDKIGKPRGLIRYASENSIATGVPLKYTTRMKLYTGLLGLLLVILGFLLMSRKDVDATVMRAPGILYQERGADSVSNLFNIKMVNKTTSAIPLSIRVKGGEGKVEIIGKNTIDVKKEGQGAGSFFVVLPKTRIQSRKTTIELELMQGNQLIAVKETNFLGPVE